jgi:hypothetical protein
LIHGIGNRYNCYDYEQKEGAETGVNENTYEFNEEILREQGFAEKELHDRGAKCAQCIDDEETGNVECLAITS